MLLKKERVNDLLAELAKRAWVFVPTAEENGAATRFAPYQREACDKKDGSTLSQFSPAFEAINTLMPPKDILFPQTQGMYRYGLNAEGKAFVEAVPHPFQTEGASDAAEVVLFGLRSCDARSIECMDDVFLSKGYDDEFYGARRRLLTTVAIGCVEAAETCFCDSMGISPNSAPSADIQLNLSADGGAYVVAAQTERGTAALEAWRPFLEDGSVETARGACTLKVNAEGIKEKLDGLFEHPLWDALAKKCLTCGTCTFVCPTCHCFDISQENRMKEGERFRCWDSCMFSAYTEMAGHHNPRADKVSRVRQRFMHKLCFFEDRYGKSLCVGCGRCVEKCPVALDITCLIDEIAAINLDDVDVVASVKGAVGVAS
jgi:ferredoxin